MSQTQQSRLRQLWFSDRRAKFTAMFTTGLLGADPALAEEFIARMARLVATDKADRDIYRALAAFRADTLDRFLVCKNASNARRLVARTAVVENMIPEGCAPHHVLDVGCGDGFITDGLSKVFNAAGAKMYGIDIAPPAPGKHNFEFLAYDNNGNIPVPDKSFDFAVLLMVLHHVPQPQKVLSEIARVLEPGGYLLVRETDADTEERQLFNTVMDEIFYTVLDNNEYLAYTTRFRDQASWKKMFNECGLDIVKIDNREKENAFTPNWFLLTPAKPKF